MTISFSLNEHDVPPLSNACLPILSNFSGSITRFYQRKPLSNVKHVNVHVSPVWVTSVSELVKPLNVRKPVPYNNATKRNVCNASSVGKPLSLSNSTSKPVSNFSDF